MVTGVGVKWVNRQEIGLTNGQTEKVGITVWVTGLAPNPLVQALRCDKSAQHHPQRLLVDERLRVMRGGKSLDHVYALGDCALVEDNPLPCTAQVARQQATYLGNSTLQIFNMICSTGEGGQDKGQV